MVDPEAKPVKVVIYRREIVDVEVHQCSIDFSAVAGARTRGKQPHSVGFASNSVSRNHNLTVIVVCFPQEQKPSSIGKNGKLGEIGNNKFGKLEAKVFV